MAANREREQLIPIEQLIPQALELGVDLTQLTFGNLSLGGDRSRLQAFKDYLTINGHRLLTTPLSAEAKLLSSTLRDGFIPPVKSGMLTRLLW